MEFLLPPPWALGPGACTRMRPAPLNGGEVGGLHCGSLPLGMKHSHSG